MLPLFLDIITYAWYAFLWKIYIYNMDGHMNPTPYVVHIGTKIKASRKL